ncbi:MAG: hypothetical protein A2081_04360 [Elusimicrobia bacterium GWC2_61_19]|nr:MAG: hypothetical protein A2081_04360 [Elusimicrobia bacterium GWC2_61_19]
MTMPPKISVIIINYNYGRFLGDAIESVLAQDFAGEMEVLVVDDGSTDNSAELVKPYLDRVKWLPKTNGGQVSAFNHAMRHATGEWVGLLEADDTWDKNKLAKTFKRLEREQDASLIQHWLLQSDSKLRPLDGYIYPKGPEHFNFDDTLIGLPYGGTSCIVFNRARLAAMPPMPEDMLYGADICLRWAAAAVKPIANIPEVLGKRRLHGANLFGRTLYDDPAKITAAIAFHTALLNYLASVVRTTGTAPSPASLAHIARERAQMDIFHHRYSGRSRQAFSAWLKLARLLPAAPGSLFKIFSTLLIVVSPRAYIKLQGLYSKLLLIKAKKNG